jgi:polyhydroxybutyrate depolymerase
MKLVGRFLLILFSILLALLLVAAGGFRLINRTNGRLVSSGEKRYYLLHVPDSYDPAIPTPLVISMHGFAEWPAHQMQISHWNDVADQQGFIVVYPAGVDFPMRWRLQGGTNIETVFISDLIDALEGQYNIDPARIYANGLSNGGGMSLVLSCELSDRIAAVGMVSGAYLLLWEECQPTRKVPMIVFHGTADEIVPYYGGRSGPFDQPFPNIPKWVEAAAVHHGCAATPSELPVTGDVSGVRYTGCEADVVFYTIAGGGHAWPGGDPMPESIVGYTTDDIDATQTMWEFFEAHPR